MTVDSVVDDLLSRALVERDGRTYGGLQLVKLHLPTAAASQPVPDMTGQAPFRATDPDVLEADQRGLNRTS